MCNTLQTACSAQYNEASTNISDGQYYLILRHFIKGTVQPKNANLLKMYSLLRPYKMQKSLFLHKERDLEKFSIQSPVFISCLDSHSDGTHSTAEDPLVSKWCNTTFLQICSNEEKLIYILDGPRAWMARGWVNFQLIFFFWQNYRTSPEKHKNPHTGMEDMDLHENKTANIY